MKAPIETLQGKHEKLREDYEDAMHRVAQLEAENEMLQRENFTLAANQCHHGYAGENGDHRCRYQDRIARLEHTAETYKRRSGKFGVALMMIRHGCEDPQQVAADIIKKTEWITE